MISVRQYSESIRLSTPRPPCVTGFYNTVPIVGLILAGQFESNTTQMAGVGTSACSYLESAQHEVNTNMIGSTVNQSKMYWRSANEVLAL